jgi:hypothetical protein
VREASSDASRADRASTPVSRVLAIFNDGPDIKMARQLELSEIEFISVGADCQPAHHIRRLTEISKTSFFDWIYSGPRSVPTLIKGNFQQILEPASLEWDLSGTNPKLWDRLNDLQFEHQLKGTGEASVARVRQNYSLLGRHFMEDLNGSRPVCFVRRLHEWDGPNALAETTALAEELLAIREDAVFLALYQKRGKEAKISGRYIEAFNWQFFETWQGSDTLYEKNFDIARRVLSCVEGARLNAGVPLEESPASLARSSLDADDSNRVDSTRANLHKQRSDCPQDS